MFCARTNAEALHRRFVREAGLLPEMTASPQECGYRFVGKEGVFLKPFMTISIKSLALSEEILNEMCKVCFEYPEFSAAVLFETEVVT